MNEFLSKCGKDMKITSSDVARGKKNIVKMLKAANTFDQPIGRGWGYGWDST